MRSLKRYIIGAIFIVAGSLGYVACAGSEDVGDDAAIDSGGEDSAVDAPMSGA